MCFDPHRKHHKRFAGVGREAVCGGDKTTCDMAPIPTWWQGEAWDYWNYNTAALFGNTGVGEWYSLLSEDEGTYWRNATIVNIISRVPTKSRANWQATA